MKDSMRKEIFLNELCDEYFHQHKYHWVDESVPPGLYIDPQGMILVGDTICFFETWSEFPGPFPNSCWHRERRVIADVIDAPAVTVGTRKRQMFVLGVRLSWGDSAYGDDSLLCMSKFDISQDGYLRLPWSNEGRRERLLSKVFNRVEKRRRVRGN